MNTLTYFGQFPTVKRFYGESQIYLNLPNCRLNEKSKNIFQKFRDPSTVKRS